MSRRRKPKAQAQLDIIIPVFGRPDLLARCLASLPQAAHGIDYRLYLVDDKGPDQERLREIYGNLNGTSRVVYNESNSGFARSVNRGVKLSTSPIVLILNSDVEIQPDGLHGMLAEFDDPAVGVVGCKLLFPPQSTDPTRPAGKIQHAGLAVNFKGQMTHVNIGWSADHPKVNERRNMQAVTGACLMTRRDTWKAVLGAYKQSGDPTGGAFNEVYGAGTFEDIEYCFAARSVGYQVIYTPNAWGYHHVGASVLQDGGGYPLQRNEMIFKARCGALLAWDEWRFM